MESIQEEAKVLLQGNSTDIASAGRRLGSMAKYFGVRGELAYSNGQQGWHDIHLAVACHFLSVQLLLKFSERKDAPNPERGFRSELTLAIPVVANLACYGVVFCLDEIRLWATEILDSVNSGHHPLVPGYWEDRWFEPAVLGMVNGRTEALVNVEYAYPAQVSQPPDTDLLLRACNEHTMNLVMAGNRQPEFDASPFSLVPFDIFAYLVVHKSESELTHPLIVELPKRTGLQEAWDSELIAQARAALARL